MLTMSRGSGAPGDRSTDRSLHHVGMSSFPGNGMSSYPSLGPAGYYPSMQTQEFAFGAGGGEGLGCTYPPMPPHSVAYGGGGGGHPLLEMAAGGHGYGDMNPTPASTDSKEMLPYFNLCLICSFQLIL